MTGRTWIPIVLGPRRPVKTMADEEPGGSKGADRFVTTGAETDETQSLLKSIQSMLGAFTPTVTDMQNKYENSLRETAPEASVCDEEEER